MNLFDSFSNRIIIYRRGCCLLWLLFLKFNLKSSHVTINFLINNFRKMLSCSNIHITIESVNFGQVRSYDIRNKADHSEKYSIRLEHSSLLFMKGDLQTKWDRRIAKSIRPIKSRPNMTFRVVF